ncbi:MAG: hypothetical protein MUC48_24710 [Leptolyngbya sp. Prado105]|nr:hypothetical protein [Leptolyngbya sp. Prado105]
MNATSPQNRHDTLIARLHQFATNPSIDIKVFRTWLSEQRFSDEEIASARLNYLLIRLDALSKSNQPQTETINFQSAIARLQYSDTERQSALKQFNRSAPQAAPVPQRRQPVRATVAAPNPLDIGKAPAPDDRLKDETHQLGLKIAEVATQFKVPLVYNPERSRKSIRVKRLFFQPQATTDLTKVGGLRSNFVGHAGMSPQASILVVPGGVEIHDPIPGDEWERPHFKRYVAKPESTLIPQNGFTYTVGVDLNGKALIKNEVIGLLISGAKKSGKSQHFRSLLCELCLKYEPRYLQFALFDVCGATFQDFEGSPWLWQSPCLDSQSYEKKMEAVFKEALNREQIFAKHNVPHIEAWNRKFPDKPLPRIIVAIEEFGETVSRVGHGIANNRPAAMSRANRKQGIDFVIATQIPNQDDFDSDLLRNLFDRVVFQCADIGASYIAFGYNDDAGVSLQGKGDGFLKDGSAPIRFQSLYLGDDDGLMLVKQINTWGSSTYGAPEMDVWDFEEPELDPDREIYDRILQHEPEFKANRISETEYLCRVFQFADRAKMTGNTKNKYRTQAAQIKGKFRNA